MAGSKVFGSVKAIRSLSEAPCDVVRLKHVRFASAVTTRATQQNGQASMKATVHTEQTSSGLSRVPTSSLLRSLVIGSFFSHPLLFKPGFAILRRIANSRSAFLNPDSNPLLNLILKPLLYDQFCAGVDRREICQTRDSIKGMGYAGIILCYGKEIQISKTNELRSTGALARAEIQHWENGNLETLDMVGAGDWLGIKLTGAGAEVTNALMQNRDPPAEFTKAMHAICEKALSRKCRIWIDAEQQVLQPSIDKFTIDLMRYYNRDGNVLVYNTIQAYLKAARSKLRDQLASAKSENWTLAVKLVRGAYIDNDQRDLIHDTKKDTDESYNSIVRDLLSGDNLGSKADEFPEMQLFLAGHNPESVSAAWKLIQDLDKKGKLKVLPEFGQLQGMGDQLGCKLLQQCEDLERETGSEVAIPKVYKCLTWGSVQECLQYLFRRAVENSGGTARMKDGLSAYSAELRRRAMGILKFRK